MSAIVNAQTNIQWRGTDRNGIYHETGLAEKWPAEGPALKWHFDGLGEGHSSVAIADDKIYITGMKNKQGILYALDLNGKMLMQKEFGPEWNESYPGTRSTVTVNDGKIYLISSMGEVICFNQKTLDIIWHVNMLSTYNASNITWGINEAALIVGNLVIATPGGSTNNMIALEKNTGKLVWTSPGAGEPSAYCSPLYIADQQIPQIVTHTGSHIIGVNPLDGKTLWTYSWPNQYSIHANTPVYSNGMIFCSSGYGCGSVMLKLVNGGKSVEKVWSNDQMDNRLGGMVKIGDYIYGSGDKSRNWFCIEWNTGEVKYKQSGGPGNVIANNNMLYYYSERGEMLLVKATPEKFDEISKFKVTMGTAQHWAHTVIYKGVLYVRHGDVLMAYNIK